MMKYKYVPGSSELTASLVIWLEVPPGSPPGKSTVSLSLYIQRCGGLLPYRYVADAQSSATTHTH